MKPIIGISAGREIGNTQFYKTALAQKYTDAIINAGGTPLIIPLGMAEEQLEDIANAVDGIMVTGGGDMATEIFNGQAHPRVCGVDALRDETEFKLVRFADKMQKPLLGICRGNQVINVAFGGTLFTDIAAQVPEAKRHDWYPNIPRDQLSHTISITKDAKLVKIFGGTEIAVNSLHHQSIDKIGEGLLVTAHAPDGIIESIEKPDHPYLIGVQWHPEWLTALPAMQNLFKTFVNACK